jgi:SAM-dependent methyltransferase
MADPAFRLFERLQAVSGRDVEPADGFPLPPAYLRVLTAGSPDGEAFLALGRRAADEFADLAASHGRPLDRAEVLEFGCGCGRVARHLVARGVSVSGTDLNPRLAAWCRKTLPGRWLDNGPQPPLGFADESFEVVYALSVFTHLYDASARAWLAELARVTRPGGLAILTLFDVENDPSLADALARDGFAVRRRGAEGSNLMCGYFSPEGFAERAAPAWALVDFRSSSTTANGQAIAVLRRADP